MDDIKSETVQTDHGTYRVRVVRDESADSPREDANLGTMVTSHKRYTMPHEGPHAARIDRLLTEYSPGQGFRMVDRWLRLCHGATVVLPVFGHDHGEWRFRAGERSDGQWDSGFVGVVSGFVGVVYDTPESREVCGTAPELVAQALAQEVAIYDQWAIGEVYGFVVEKRVGEQWQEVESCWNFYETDFALEEGKRAIPDAEGEAARIVGDDGMVTVNFSVTVKVKAADWALAYGVAPHEIADDVRSYFEGSEMHPGREREIESTIAWKATS